MTSVFVIHKKFNLKFNKCFIVFFLLIILKANAQIYFRGFVTDENKTPLNRARVFLKSDNETRYTFTDAKGFYQIKYENRLGNTALLIASSTGLKSDSIFISLVDNKESYSTNFELTKSSVSIEEIKIQGKRKPIEIKKDTVVYNPENFIDGSEKTVEDLLKKLPGIKVNESGSIEFKGKTVTAVMLDGGDLFNSNYMIGTRNINPNIIDQVQAIENWSDNPVLKSIGGENKVALNLKLKKDKTSFSSSLKAETDFYKRYNLGAYGLVVNRLVKTFATSNYNNVGVNKSPLDLSTNSLSFEDYQNTKYQAPFLIEKNSIDSRFGSQKAYRNQQWFASSNSLLKIGSRANLKIIGSFVKDKILLNNISENFYNLNNENIYTKDENAIVKKPRYIAGNLEFRWHKSEKEYFEILSNVSALNENVTNNLISNSDRLYMTRKTFKNLFSKNELIYTLKLKKKNALQIRALYTYDNRPQDLFITPSLLIFPDNGSSPINLQAIEASKEHLGVDFILHHLFAEDHKIQVTVGFANENYMLRSTTRSDDSATFDNFNNISYKTNSAFLNLEYFLKTTDWNINFTQNSQILKQNLIVGFINSKNLFLNKTSLSVFRNIFSKTAAFVSADISTTPISENYLFDDYILVSNRSIISNKYSLDHQTQENYNIGFTYNDSYTNQFKVIASAGYAKSKNGFIGKYFVDSNFDYTFNFRSPKPTETYNISLNVEKFVPFISSRFNLKANYYIFDYYSSINENELNEIKSRILQINLIQQFAFNFPLKIKNTLDFTSAVNQSEISTKIKSNSFSLKNELLYGFQSNIFIFKLTNEYYKPDLQQNTDFLFLNFNFNYAPKNSSFKYSLALNNILNVKYNYTKSVLDYSISYRKTELLNRVFLIGVDLSL